MVTIAKFITRIVLDAIWCVIAFLPWIVCETSVTPFQRGFFCDDDSIKHPFKESTVKSTLVIVLGIGGNVLLFLGTEAVHYFVYHESSKEIVRVKKGQSEVTIHPYIMSTYRLVVMFLFGAAVHISFVNIMKYSTGRLRPHFIDVCHPNWVHFNCTDGRGFPRYVTDATCTGTNEGRVYESRLSFPSGHASMSFYFTVFMVVYMQARFHFKFSRLFKHLLQAVLLYLALVVAVSRIFDYKHHYTDVLVGSLIGGTTAFILARYTCDLYFNPSKLNHEIMSLSNKQGEYGTYVADLETGVGSSNLPGNRNYDNLSGSNDENRASSTDYRNRVFTG